MGRVRVGGASSSLRQKSMTARRSKLRVLGIESSEDNSGSSEEVSSSSRDSSDSSFSSINGSGVASSSSGTVTSRDSYSANASSSSSDESWSSSSLDNASSSYYSHGYGSYSYSYDTDSSSSSLSTGVIIGAAVGVAIVLVLALGIYICCFRNKRRRREKEQQNKAVNEVDTTQSYPSMQTARGNYHDEVQSTLPILQTNQYDEVSSTLPNFSGASSRGIWDDPAIVVSRIPLEKVIPETRVSHGGYGEVYRGTYKGQTVAIKSLLPAIRKDIKQINSFLAEAKIMASIEHERVVRFVGVAWDSLSDLCVVTEFMGGGDLRSLLTRFEEQEHRPHGFDADKTRIAQHVAQALTYLHSLQPIVIHRDLKSRNILLDSQLNAKLTDFGVSRETNDRTMTAGVGTSLWMAPEVMMGERYDEKADVFSFGVVLTELDSHQLPYASAKSTDSGRTRPDTAILQMVAMGRLQAEFSELVPPWMKELGTACLSLDPKQRPSAANVLYAFQTSM